MSKYGVLGQLTRVFSPPQDSDMMQQIAITPLPAGWEIRMTNDGRQYFVDHNTRVTTFKGTDVGYRISDVGCRMPDAAFHDGCTPNNQCADHCAAV